MRNCIVRFVICAVVSLLYGCASRHPPIIRADPMPVQTSSSCPKLNPVSRVDVAFPRSMLVEGREGWVILEFDVSPNDGTPRNVHFFASSHPGGRFEVEVLRAFEHFRYSVQSPYQGCRAEFVFKVKE